MLSRVLLMDDINVLSLFQFVVSTLCFLALLTDSFTVSLQASSIDQKPVRHGNEEACHGRAMACHLCHGL